MRTLEEIEKAYTTALKTLDGEDKISYLEKILEELRDDHGAFCNIRCGSKVIDGPAVDLYRKISTTLSNYIF
ncbi:MAG: hypothetical protein GX127_09215 [Eubacteriaceae bacterium]|jgi:hypothetical protein|nr:hypothetical protein [Eubacteriaceae bacterium]